MIFDRLLQDSEIDALYNSQANNFAVNFTGLDNESFYDFQVCSINTTGFYSCLDKIYLINETIISEEILENNFTRVFPAFSIVSGILTLSITLFGIVFLF